MLPHGLYYGRLDLVAALSVAGAHRSGHSTSTTCARSGYAMPVQFAEIALRRELAETREDALRLVSRRVAGPRRRRHHGGLRRRGRRLGGPGALVARADLWQLTCKTRENPIPRYAQLDVARLA